MKIAERKLKHTDKKNERIPKGKKCSTIFAQTKGTEADKKKTIECLYTNFTILTGFNNLHT